MSILGNYGNEQPGFTMGREKAPFEQKKSQEEIKRDLDAAAIRFKRIGKQAGLSEEYYSEQNQDKINIAVFGE